MAEDLADYLREVGIRTYYLHSEQDAFQRVEVLRDLRLGVFDCLVGINLLREGLDLPEVSLVAVLDADKEGFLRNEARWSRPSAAPRATSTRTPSSTPTASPTRCADAIDETHRRRQAQDEYNKTHDITPVGITKEIRDIAADVANQVRDEFEQKMVAEDGAAYDDGLGANIPEDMTPDQIARMITEIESRMKQAARDLEFEKAAALRDQIIELRRDQAALGEDLQQWSDQAYGRRRRPLRRKEPVSRQR